MCSTLGEIPLLVIVGGCACGSFQMGPMGQQASKSMTKMLGEKEAKWCVVLRCQQAFVSFCSGVKTLLLLMCSACFGVNKYTLGGENGTKLSKYLMVLQELAVSLFCG